MSPPKFVERLEARQLLAFAVNVNFQPMASAAPAGYRVDGGAPYGQRANGLTYGWSADNRINARDRNLRADQRFDTFAHLQRGGSVSWSIAVPNGQYRVRVVAGDPSFFDSVYRLSVEGVPAVNQKPSAANPFVEGTVTVGVTDGRLTIGSAAGAVNNKLAFVEIRQFPPSTDSQLSARIPQAFAYAQTAANRTIADIANSASVYVERTNADGTWNRVTSAHWAAGFFPGTMWQLFERTGNTAWRDQATRWTTPLSAHVTQNGDLAFKFLTTYLPLWRSSGSSAHRQVLLNAAATQNGLWNSTVGAFRTSWFTTRSGNPRANFAVLVDRTTDMELLFWAARETGNAQYYDRAVRHVEKVILNNVRADGSVSQFAMYDQANGEFIMHETYQGYSNSSAWSRGQAWAVLSLAMAARETGRADFAAAARKVADFFIDNLPADRVPFWDFRHPAIPNTFRDSSAAAIAASGLLDLSTLLTDPAQKARYRAAAEAILKSLLGPGYWAEGSIHRGLTLHGAVNVPNSADGRDCSIVYADYYLLKAMNQWTAIVAG